jgi:peptidoglycan/xylan/chitin deacetylase (PgdA/CDA1 family)
MATMRGAVQKASGLTTGSLALATGRLPIRRHGAVVLCYHDVGTGPAEPTDWYVSTARFRSHIDWLRGWGHTIVPLAEIVDRLATDRDLDGLAAITFDDALLGVGDQAAIVLEDLRVPATVFVVTDVLGVAPPFWPGAARTLRADELRALTATGLVQLGSHTRTHRALPGTDAETRRHELSDSRAALEALTGSNVDLFAYPSGRHDLASEAAVRDAGYRAAFTFSFGRVTAMTDRFAIPRFCMTEDHDRLRLARQLARPPRMW